LIYASTHSRSSATSTGTIPNTYLVSGDTPPSPRSTSCAGETFCYPGTTYIWSLFPVSLLLSIRRSVVINVGVCHVLNQHSNFNQSTRRKEEKKRSKERTYDLAISSRPSRLLSPSLLGLHQDSTRLLKPYRILGSSWIRSSLPTLDYC